MTMIIEDGTGVSGANAYTTEAEVDTYLTDRNREAENLWSTAATAAKEAAIIAATDFIEQRWGQRFIGRKEFIDISTARATLTFTANPLTTETVVINGTTFTFDSGVAIGADTEESIDNLVTAIAASLSATVTATAEAGDTMLLESVVTGTPGNDITTVTTVTGGSWSSTTLVGGSDVAIPQPLSFPRINLVDRDGQYVYGIPAKLKQATAEYAVRAVSTSTNLMPDPTYDDTGKAVVRKKEKVGPIETDTQYEEGGAASNIIRVYPAADRLLSEYITPGGGVIRG